MIVPFKTFVNADKNIELLVVTSNDNVASKWSSTTLPASHGLPEKRDFNLAHLTNSVMSNKASKSLMGESQRAQWEKDVGENALQPFVNTLE